MAVGGKVRRGYVHDIFRGGGASVFWGYLLTLYSRVTTSREGVSFEGVKGKKPELIRPTAGDIPGLDTSSNTRWWLWAVFTVFLVLSNHFRAGSSRGSVLWCRVGAGNYLD